MRLLKSGLVAVGLTLCAAISSCVMTKAEGEQMMADISRLKNEVSTLQRERSDYEITVNKRIDALEGVTYRQANADSMEKEQLRKEVAALRGQLEEAQRGMEGAQGSAQPEVAPKDKQAHFEWAKEAFDSGDFSLAYMRLESFVKAYQDDRKFGADAYLMKGDAAVHLAKDAASKAARMEYYKKALASYQDLLTRFPSSRSAEGHYKVGETSEAMGFIAEAKLFYEAVKKNHKTSSYAKEASKRLVALNKKKNK